MKEEDVRIGMKVKLNGTGDECIVLSEKDYRTMYGNVYSLINIKTGRKKTLNAYDFEPYIDISDTQRLERLEKFIQQSPYVGILLIPVATPSESYLQLAGAKDVDYGGYDTLLEGKTLRGVLDKLEELSNNTEKERLEEEIQKSFEEHVKKYGNDFSLFSCYKAGYLSGREGK